MASPARRLTPPERGGTAASYTPTGLCFTALGRIARVLGKNKELMRETVSKRQNKWHDNRRRGKKEWGGIGTSKVVDKQTPPPLAGTQQTECTVPIKKVGVEYKDGLTTGSLIDEPLETRDAAHTNAQAYILRRILLVG